jgi:hypothetical protein
MRGGRATQRRRARPRGVLIERDGFGDDGVDGRLFACESYLHDDFWNLLRVEEQQSLSLPPEQAEADEEREGGIIHRNQHVRN